MNSTTGPDTYSHGKAFVKSLCSISGRNLQSILMDSPLDGFSNPWFLPMSDPFTDEAGGLGLFEHRYAVPSLQTICKNAIRDWIYR